ncbi:MAG: DnaJ domain-containing protein [Nitrospiraceae bacterium]
MGFSANRLSKYQRGMRRRIDMLRAKNADSIDFAVDYMMQERVDSFFRVEQGLDEVERSLQQIEEELLQIHDLSGAIRLESRLEFVEDRWDELDSEVRERPRRRRRKINLADFLKAAGGGEPGAPRSEISTAHDAYEALGLEFGTALADVTTMFRQRAKELHPDARNGDRSSEPELRRILEAYQFLKEYLSLSNTEPPIARGSEYRPPE